jgi:competence protein ComGC
MDRIRVKTPERIRNEDGFTVQELFVVLIIGSVLVGLGLTTFAFVSKLHSSWQKKAVLRAAVDRAAQAIAIDIMRADRLLEVTDSTLTLRVHEDRPIRYEFNGNTISRDGLRWSDSDAIRLVATVSLGPILDHGAPELARIRVRGTSGDQEAVAELTVTTKRSSREQVIKAMRYQNLYQYQD